MRAASRQPASRRRSDNVRRDMAYGTLDGSLYSVMVGTGETYLVAFALAAGMHKATAGMLTPVPQLIGAALGLAIPMLLPRLGSIRRMAVSLAVGQALAFVPFVVLALTGLPAHLQWVLFAAAGFYWLCNYACGVCWNAWVSDLYPKGIRARYFGWRIRIQQMSTVTGVITAGLILDAAERRDPADGGVPDYLWIYAILFAIAATTRLLSALMLTRHSEPHRLPRGFRDVPLREFVGRFRHDSGGRLLIAMLGMSCVCFVSAPFFAPYMLSDEGLGLSYAAYMTLMAVNVGGKSLMLPHAGRLTRHFGPRPVLLASAAAIVPLSGLWMVSDSVWWLGAVNITAGAVWACYEIATFLLLFETIPQSQRIGMLVRYNLFNAAAQTAGGLLGLALLNTLTELHSPHAGFFAVFVGSSVLRICTLPLFARVHPPRFRIRPLLLRTLSVGPGGAGSDRPVLGAIDDEDDDRIENADRVQTEDDAPARRR